MRDITHGRRFFILCFQVRLLFITLGCAVVSIALAILVMPTVIVLYIMYFAVYLVLKIKHGKKITRANGLDILYAVEYPGSALYLNSVSCLDGVVTLEELKERTRLFLAPEALLDGEHIYQRAWQRMEKRLGYTFFFDDPDFDENNHVIVVTKKDLFGDEEPEEYLKRIMSDKGNEDSYGEFIEQESQLICQRMLELYGGKKLSPERPQWEVIYYKHTGQDRCTILFHGHHCISDGISVLRYFFEKFGDKKVNYTLPYTFHQDNFLKRWGVNLFSFFMLPFGIWRLTYNTGLNPLNGPTLSGKKMYIKSRLYSAQKMKEVKNKCDCSMITLLMNAFAYALRRNYERKGAHIRKTLILVPVPLQDFTKDPVFKNDHGLQGILLRTAPLDIEKDSALSRLDETKKLMYISVRDPSFLPIQWIIYNIGPLLPQSILKNVFRLKGFTSSFSNIAGPQDEYFTLCNKKGVGKECMFWVPDRDPMGMGLSSVGYMGEVGLSLIVDKVLMKNYREAYLFLEDFFEEFDNLRKELHLDDYKD